MTHPLLDVMLDAARGVFPAADGGVTFLPELPDGNRAIVAMTGHAFIAAGLDASDFDGIVLDGFGAALAPPSLLLVADGGEIGDNDVTLVASGTGHGIRMPTTTAWNAHPRVRHARHLRTAVTVYGDDRGFVTLSKGLAGRTEVSIEIADTSSSSGVGRGFIAAAIAAVTAGAPLFAGVSPGNARSLRAFLASGFVPIGSEVIVDRSVAPSASTTSSS